MEICLLLFALSSKFSSDRWPKVVNLFLSRFIVSTKVLNLLYLGKRWRRLNLNFLLLWHNLDSIGCLVLHAKDWLSWCLLGKIKYWLSWLLGDINDWLSWLLGDIKYWMTRHILSWVRLLLKRIWYLVGVLTGFLYQ